jgi:amidase
VGEDTESSILGPAVRASLYSMRPTMGLVPKEGVVPASLSFDTPGPMAKDVRDLADMLTVLVDPSKTKVPGEDYSTALDADWSEVRIGTLDPLVWKYPASMIKPIAEVTEQMVYVSRSGYDPKVLKYTGQTHERGL